MGGVWKSGSLCVCLSMFLCVYVYAGVYFYLYNDIHLRYF